MKSWKLGLQLGSNTRDWGMSQSMPGTVVGDVPLHCPPTGSIRWGPQLDRRLLQETLLQDEIGSTFSELRSFQEQRGGGWRFRSYPGDALPPAPSCGMP